MIGGKKNTPATSKERTAPKPVLNFGHVLGSESSSETPQTTPREAPTSRETSPRADLPLSARFYTPPLAKAGAGPAVVMKADLTWGVREDPLEKAIERAKRESEEKGKGKKKNRGIRLF